MLQFKPACETIVIKLGGHAMDHEDLLKAFIEDVAFLTKKKTRIVIAHGGGPHINDLLHRLNLESRFVNGLRVTDANIMEAVELALCAKVNKELTRRMLRHGIRAVGVSGQDGGFLKAVQLDPQLGKVGKVDDVDSRLIITLLEAGFTPVIAPVALDTTGEPMNINADTAAGAIAGALKADYFALVSDVPGVLDAEKKLVPKLDRKQINSMREAGVINGGMIPKTECCLAALANGCGRTLILDGRQKHSLLRFIQDGEMLGTLIE